MLGHEVDEAAFPMFATTYADRINPEVALTVASGSPERQGLASLLLAVAPVFLLPGLWAARQTLRRPQGWLEQGAFWLLVGATALMPLLHARFFFVGEHLRALAAVDPSAHPVLLDTTDRLLETYYTGWGIALLAWFGGWATWLVVVAMARTTFPRAAALLTPIGLLPLVLVGLGLLPDALGVPLGRAPASLATSGFFTVLAAHVQTARFRRRHLEAS
ncbi:MAG: hypothetical protein AAGA48_00715 [Myxococcota bacterium]